MFVIRVHQKVCACSVWKCLRIAVMICASVVKTHRCRQLLTDYTISSASWAKKINVIQKIEKYKWCCAKYSLFTRVTACLCIFYACDRTSRIWYTTRNFPATTVSKATAPTSPKRSAENSASSTNYDSSKTASTARRWRTARGTEWSAS